VPGLAARARGSGGTRDFTGRFAENTIKVDNHHSRRCVAWSAIAAADCSLSGVAFLLSVRSVPVAEARPEMAQAIVNPEELRRFAARLKQFNNEMMTQLTTLHGQLSGLSQSWRDREHDKFVEEFEQTLQVVKRFVDSTNQHIPFLLRKAERIEEYLQQR
jgi:uncharacterized protein YukE